MARLIVTADDFGVSLAVNEGVERAHREGILTAASLMVAGNAAIDAVDRARRLPKLGVGLHLVLVDGRPTLPPERIPLLVDANGRFRDDMLSTALRLAIRPAARAQLAAEIEAQFIAFAATGLPLDHVNAHKHFHINPVIASTVLRVGKRFEMRAIRAPLERGRASTEWLLARRLQAQSRAAGLLVPDQVVGLAWSGAFNTERMRAAIAALPPGLTEVYTHPATADAYPGSASGYRYRDELAALIDPIARETLQANAIVSGPFADFTEA